ncbi:site-specific integrase [Halorubrum trueperi]|uniref:Site-specific integrase n=1 Tax=Halorubrum trueperi TaxID=2004704 RepID=A0ABD5UMH7_9EURY
MPTKSPRRSAKDALEPDTYFQLYLGALQIEDPDRRLIACFVILVAGRLGLRIGEILHLREEHIHWKRGEICIPSFDPCACHQCWVKALNKWGRKGLKELQANGEWDNTATWKSLSAAEHEEVTAKADYCTPENLTQIIYTDQFTPKYDRSARVIAFGWSYRLTACLSTFFDTFDCLDWQRHSVNRLLKEAAENARGLDPEHISAHKLRATGETFFADISLDPKMLRDLGGWQQLKTGDRYWAKSGRVNTLKLYNIMGMKDEAPPVVPEEPKHEFPIVCNPVPFQNEPFQPVGPDDLAYDRDSRLERHQEQEQKPIRLRHPREVSLPFDRAGFPDPDEITYDPMKHTVPGHRHDSSDDVAVQTGEVVTKATTLYEYMDTHRHTRSPDPRTETESHRVDLVDTTLERYRDTDGSRMYLAIDIITAMRVSLIQTGGWVYHRLQREWREYWLNNPTQTISPERATKAIAMYLIGVVFPLVIILGLIH